MLGGRTLRGSLQRISRLPVRVRSAMAERLAGLPRADALLLLPSMPATAAVLGPDSGWGAALAHWGVAVGPASSADLLVATGGAPPADVLGAPMVVLPGTRRLGRLRRAGYAVTTYRVRWVSWHVVVAAPDRRGHRLARSTWVPGSEGVRVRVGRALRPGAVTVATLGGNPSPATVRMSGAAASASGTCLAVDVRDDRRRAAFLVPDVCGRAGAVVKAARSPGQEGRGPREQRVLSLLPDDGDAPRPLGAGQAGPVEWSAETAVRGRPLRALESGRGDPVVPVLEALAGWLGDVAVRTAVPVDWCSVGAGDATVALRGPAADLGTLLTGLADVPAVLSHGDLASGLNVVVDRSGQPAVLDWETAREHGLPLQDLLPLLCSSLARMHGRGRADREADHVLALATGRSPESGWLFAQVAGYADRVGLPPASLGPLALLAWGHQASMRQVRDELLVTAGLPVGEWTSLAELVLPRWEREVGAEWPQLRAHLR